jgi:hypothetical protein
MPITKARLAAVNSALLSYRATVKRYTLSKAEIKRLAK